MLPWSSTYLKLVGWFIHVWRRGFRISKCSDGLCQKKEEVMAPRRCGKAWGEYLPAILIPPRIGNNVWRTSIALLQFMLIWLFLHDIFRLHSNIMSLSFTKIHHLIWILFINSNIWLLIWKYGLCWQIEASIEELIREYESEDLQT